MTPAADTSRQADALQREMARQGRLLRISGMLWFATSIVLTVAHAVHWVNAENRLRHTEDVAADVADTIRVTSVRTLGTADDIKVQVCFALRGIRVNGVARLMSHECVLFEGAREGEVE
jgi:hypothetical protein